MNAFALGLVVVAGGLCLAMPFWPDQALFTLYARELTRGAVLSRDLLDIKQPGIFLFYNCGGLLFGFTEVGIHLFELAFWLAFSVFVLVAIRPYVTTRWQTPLVPIFTVVVYYLSAGVPDLTQIEILVAFPILVAWWLIDQADPGTRRGCRMYAAAGLATAAVVLFKHLYFVIVLAFLAYAVLRSRRRSITVAEIQRSLGAFVIALVVPLLFVAAYFAAHGQLGRIWWMYFEFGPQTQLFGTRSLADLKFGARHFMIGHAPMLILAFLGGVHGLRQRTRPRLDLVAGMVLWTAAGFIAFLMQAWWDYKWMLFTVPVGILAVIGTEALAAAAASAGRMPRPLTISIGVLLATLSFVLGAGNPQMQTRLLLSVVIGICAGITAEFLIHRRRLHGNMLQLLFVALAVSVGLTAVTPVQKIRALMDHGFAFTPTARANFQRSLNFSYRAADNDLEVLRSGLMLAGPIHVFGDPIVLLRANRSPAVPFLYQHPYAYDLRAWQEMDRDLRSTLPPYIVLGGYYEPVIRSRYPAIIEFIHLRYKVAFIGASGTWYVRR